MKEMQCYVIKGNHKTRLHGCTFTSAGTILPRIFSGQNPSSLYNKIIYTLLIESCVPISSCESLSFVPLILFLVSFKSPLLL